MMLSLVAARAAYSNLPVSPCGHLLPAGSADEYGHPASLPAVCCYLHMDVTALSLVMSGHRRPPDPLSGQGTSRASSHKHRDWLARTKTCMSLFVLFDKADTLRPQSYRDDPGIACWRRVSPCCQRAVGATACFKPSFERFRCDILLWPSRCSSSRVLQCKRTTQFVPSSRPRYQLARVMLGS